MRVSVNNKGRVGVSFSTSGRKGSGGGGGGFIGFIIIVGFIVFLISKCSGPSDEDIKQEREKASSYKTAYVSDESIYNNICANDVTADGAEKFFSSNLSNHWLTVKATVKDVSDSVLSASIDNKNKSTDDSHLFNIEVNVESDKILRKGETVEISFVPVSFDMASCNITGKFGNY